MNTPRLNPGVPRWQYLLFGGLLLAVLGIFLYTRLHKPLPPVVPAPPIRSIDSVKVTPLQSRIQDEAKIDSIAHAHR